MFSPLSLKKHILLAVSAAALLTACGGSDNTTPAEESSSVVAATDTVAAEELTPKKVKVKFSTPDEMIAYMNRSADSARFASGVLPRMVETAPSYADSILNSAYERFLVVDKSKMRVFVFDSCGVQLVNYGIAVGKGAGNKQQKGDCRTPEGYFTAEGIYDSTKWLYTDDNGVTSPVKGQFGPRYIRLRSARRSFPVGIHGTCAPWSIGGRRSHGCIRLTNENIMALVEYAEPGMPIIVLPSERDQKANKKDGKLSLYFVTCDTIPDAHPYFPPESSFLPQEPVDSAAVETPEVPAQLPAEAASEATSEPTEPAEVTDSPAPATPSEE